MAIIWSSGPGEGWLDALFPSFTWMQVYDRRSTTQIPVVIPASGGTQPLVPDTPPIQVPSVVPGPRPTFNNPIPPPLIPVGADVLPPGRVDLKEDEKVALDDWLTPVSDIITAWRGNQQSVFQAPAQFAGTSLPTTTAGTAAVATANGLPKGMYVDVHGHLVHRRKRRRPCITQTDLGLAHQIAGLPNNANVRMFLAKCVH